MATSTGQGTFAVLEQVHAARGFEAAFHQATGLSVRLRPLPAQADALLLQPEENPLCALAYGTTAGRELCSRMQRGIRLAFQQKRGAQPVTCIAGLVIVAVPVRVCGEQVAMLHTNRVFTRAPQPEDVQRFADLVAGWGGQPDVERLHQDFAAIPVVTCEQLDAMVRLLGIYAEHLGDLAGRRLLAEEHGEPSAVAQAVAYVREHQTERLHLRQVAAQARLSPFYFCKLFHRTMGVTFTEYLIRLRLEAAKDMLLSQNTPVGHVALAAGFGSVPHFNRAFKRYTGLTPTMYRTTHTGVAQARPLAA